jgi:hypothetical protein
MSKYELMVVNVLQNILMLDKYIQKRLVFINDKLSMKLDVSLWFVKEVRNSVEETHRRSSYWLHVVPLEEELRQPQNGEHELLPRKDRYIIRWLSARLLEALVHNFECLNIITLIKGTNLTKYCAHDLCKSIGRETLHLAGRVRSRSVLDMHEFI